MPVLNHKAMTAGEIETVFRRGVVPSNGTCRDATIQTMHTRRRRENGAVRRGLWISIVALVVCLLGGGVAHAGDQYLCVADQVTGFFYDAGSKRWKTTQFNAAEMKYIIRPSKSESQRLEIVEMALDMVSCWSDAGFNSGPEISFDCLTGQFIFNKKTGRFIKTDTLGYITGDSVDMLTNRNLTPHIAIGRCSRF
jgi:hypothetical protein